MAPNERTQLLKLVSTILAETQLFETGLNQKLATLEVDSNPSEHVLVQSLIQGLEEVGVVANVAVQRIQKDIAADTSA